MNVRAPLQHLRTGLVLLCLLGCLDSVEPNNDVIDLASANRLAVGDMASCALDADQTTWCWGDNQAYRGRGLAASGYLPAKTPAISPMAKLVSLAVGGSQHRCGLTADGTAICWGRGGFGQMGRGVADSSGNIPGEVIGGAKWASIYTGRIHTCAIDKAGDAWCWGINQRGELGDPNAPHGSLTVPSTSPTPVKVFGGLKWKSLAPGWQHTCGIAADDTAYCWGDNNYGELGIGTTDTVSHLGPSANVVGNYHFTQLASGWRFTCGITTEKKVVCWGLNAAGQLGDGTTTNRTSPVPASGDFTFTRIAVSFTNGSGYSPLPSSTVQNPFGSVCALREDGAPMCWGYNGDGQLGDGTITARFVPTPVIGGLKLTSIALGTTHTCGMRGNAVWCWGSREFFQIGSGFSVDALTPPIMTPVPVSTPFDK